MESDLQLPQFQDVIGRWLPSSPMRGKSRNQKQVIGPNMIMVVTDRDCRCHKHMATALMLDLKFLKGYIQMWHSPSVANLCHYPVIIIPEGEIQRPPCRCKRLPGRPGHHVGGGSWSSVKRKELKGKIATMSRIAMTTIDVSTRCKRVISSPAGSDSVVPSSVDGNVGWWC